MKKSRIILPAIALLAVSGIASVSGTVAWFTAANAAKFSLSEMTAVNVDSNLLMHLDTSDSAQRNVSCNDTNKTVTVNGVLTNASVDVDGNKTWLANEVKDATTGAATSVDVTEKYREVAMTGTAGVSGTGDSAKNIYYSYSWKATFQSNAASATEFDLFFDLSTSSVTSGTGDAAKLAPAYRIAMTASGTSASTKMIWNPKMETSKCVYANAANATGDYKTKDGWSVVATGSKANTSLTRATAKSALNYGYLGTLTSASDVITVTFTVWCEGEDSTCINANAGGTLSGAFNFYAINSAEYTTGA